MTKLKAKKNWKNWTPEDVLGKLDIHIPEEEKTEVLKYIENHLESLKSAAEEVGKPNGIGPEVYIIGSLRNAYSDGRMSESGEKYDETNTEATDVDVKGDEDQEIIEVSQTEVKKALKALLTKQNSIIATLYAKHDEYNQQYFDGRLSVPLITIEKMSNKTLGAYSHMVDNAGIENHIYMNRNFIALNTETRILETLRHEMIHQCQDEVLYEKHDKDGNLLHTGAKRPKNWHNKDFKEWAKKVGIVANGKNCTWNPAKMPEPKSYNRKFACKCVATNGYPMTIWSTRKVHAVCSVCGCEYTEVKKSGGVIKVSQSDVEGYGKDAIELRMKEDYNSFDKFENKAGLTQKVNELKAAKIAYKEGIYQKGHNAYAKGFHYWIAWNEPTEAKQAKSEDKAESAKLAVKALEELEEAENKAGKATGSPKRKKQAGNKSKGVSSNDKGNVAEET